MSLLGWGSGMSVRNWMLTLNSGINCDTMLRGFWWGAAPEKFELSSGAVWLLRATDTILQYVVVQYNFIFSARWCSVPCHLPFYGLSLSEQCITLPWQPYSHDLSPYVGHVEQTCLYAPQSSQDPICISSCVSGRVWAHSYGSKNHLVNSMHRRIQVATDVEQTCYWCWKILMGNPLQLDTFVANSIYSSLKCLNAFLFVFLKMCV